MTYNKKTVLGIILLLLVAFAVYSCIMVFGLRRREPERAKLVIGRLQNGEIQPGNGR